MLASMQVSACAAKRSWKHGTLSPLAALFDDSIGGRHYRPADPCSHVNMMTVKMECMSRQQEIARSKQPWMMMLAIV
jgi:hypothetical protein